MAVSCGTVFRIVLILAVVVAAATACSTLPVDKMLKDFLVWIDNNLGPWGPLVLAVAYIPLTVLAVPASILTLGGGYLYGLPIGLIADSIGSTLGCTAAFVVGKTIGRSYVESKCKDYPQFQAVAIAIQRSGFKCCYIDFVVATTMSRSAVKNHRTDFICSRIYIWQNNPTTVYTIPQVGCTAGASNFSLREAKIVLLLRLVPLLPFNILNYLLSVTPIGLGQYILASWIGMMPITLVLVYVGTTIKDLSDVTHGWHEISTARWILLIASLVASVVLIILVTKIAKRSLAKALEEDGKLDSFIVPLDSATVSEEGLDVHQPLLVKTEPIANNAGS